MGTRVVLQIFFHPVPAHGGVIRPTGSGRELLHTPPVLVKDHLLCYSKHTSTSLRHQRKNTFISDVVTWGKKLKFSRNDFDSIFVLKDNKKSHQQLKNSFTYRHKTKEFAFLLKTENNIIPPTTFQIFNAAKKRHFSS